jgi:cobyrinic acid a,c-diamide synthase
MTASGLVIAAPATGSGKTVITLAIAAALRRRGRTVSCFKVGPDYLDPRFLAAASGRVAGNLDPFAMRPETLAQAVDTAAMGADLLLGEGVMGLFDGAADGTGSTGDLAALLALPVILVVDAKAMGASVAALIQGFLRFREEVEVAGIILNRVAGERHAKILRRACDDAFATPILGLVPEIQGLRLPSRHLGLVQAGEHPALDHYLAAAAATAEHHLDLERLLRLARLPGLAGFGQATVPLPPLGQRLAVARDQAFGFLYPHVLAGWRAAGAEISFLAPLADEPVPADADALFLPGGYPELHAGAIAAASRFLGSVRRLAARGGAIYGECGGYMALGTGLVDAEGGRHAMAGLLPVETSFAQRKLQLGYRRIQLLASTPFGPAGSRFHGHEFHYAGETRNTGPPLFRAGDATGAEPCDHGAVAGRVMGSFLHLIDRE